MKCKQQFAPLFLFLLFAIPYFEDSIGLGNYCWASDENNLQTTEIETTLPLKRIIFSQPSTFSHFVSLTTSESSGQKQERYSLTIHVSLVNLFVTVTDQRGGVIQDLSKDDFFLWEDDKKQRITHFATHEQSPLSVAVLLDVSGSMALRNKYSNSLKIIQKLAQNLKVRDELALFSFSDNIVTINVPFTAEKEKVVHMAEQIKPYGKTALYWAISVMPRIMGKPKYRQAILLLTDGIDNRSILSLDEVLDNVQKTRLPIYTINFAYQSLHNVRVKEDYARITILRTISQKTGGVYREVISAEDLDLVFNKIMSELRFQYILGYNSNQKPKPGSYHKIRLQTKKKKYIVRVRKGYYVSK